MRFSLGSSPLTRGKLPGPPDPVPDQRLIPAHAGKTCAAFRHPARQAAHPRSRGENPGRLLIHETAVGSSPLTRGKHGRETLAFHPARLIPAHAGKTPRHERVLLHGEAHPRSRGENSPSRAASRARLGSSPLTRGKHFLTCAFTAQIDQILETLELAVSFGSYSVWVACATDAPQDQVRSIGLVLPSSRGAS